MTFSERVQATTRQYLLPKVVYQVLGSNVLASRLVGNGKKGRGYAVEKAIKYTTSNQAISFSGLDTFQAQQMETKIRLKVEMKAARQAIGLSGLDLLANQDSDVRVTDLMVETMEETQDELFDKMGDYAYTDGQGNMGKDPNGLNYIIDDGTNAPLFEGQSRATYPVLNSTVTDLTAVSGELSLPRLATLYTNVSSGTGMTTPTLMISGEAEQDFYEQLLTPTVRETYSAMGYYTVTKDSRGTVRAGSQEGLVGKHGFVALSYKGIPWVRDEKATQRYGGRVAMLNEEYVDWFGWAVEGNVAKQLGYEAVSFKHTQVETTFSESPMSDFTGFNWRPIMSAYNQFAGIGDMIIVGNMASWQPRRQGVLTNVSGV
jgi:hypothetical protein